MLLCKTSGRFQSWAVLVSTRNLDLEGVHSRVKRRATKCQGNGEAALQGETENAGTTHGGEEKIKGKMGHGLQHLESCEASGCRTSIHQILRILVWGALPHLKQIDQLY